MARLEILITIALASLACCSEIDDIETKKRDAGKGISLNTIPSGAQKQYSYIYQSSPQSSSPNHSYDNQGLNSFYPSQSSSQYYTNNPSSEPSPAYSPQSQGNQINSHRTSQFVPLNFLPNPGYQSKYHVVQPKSAGNVQLAILQQPNALPPQQIIPYAQLPQLFAPNPANQIHPQTFGSLPQFNFATSHQPISYSGPYLGQPSAMLLLAQPNPSAIGALPYQNHMQSMYSYNPSYYQPKYGVTYSSAAQHDYDKLPGPINQGLSKDENEISSQSGDYAPQPDLNSSYKDTYPGRSSYSKPI